MTSTIKVNNIQNQCGANIINENSNTITIGASGDTVALASGASQSGFGRSGSVNWQTSIKTGDFTAASGEGYFVNTTSGPITLTLPSSPSVGDIVAMKDYANTFDTNTLTIGRNSQPIGGQALDSVLTEEGIAVTLVYADATKGWLVVDSGLQSEAPGPVFIAATGGTESTSGNFKIHTFTGPGTFCISNAGNAAGSNTLDYLVVAGGGGSQCGGGGAGGFRSSNDTCMPAPQTSPLANSSGLPASTGAIPVTIGAGGTGPFGSPSNNTNTPGSASVFSTISSAGGGRSAPASADAGGSGAGGYATGQSPAGGAGNTPPVSPPQGQPGGTVSGPGASAGGGGAGGTGGNLPGPRAGGIGSFMVSAGFAGCHGTTGPVSGARYFAGGGGGGAPAPGGYANVTAVSGGGGTGIANSSNTARPGIQCGQTNTGGGGGGAWFGTSGSGGSGIVIIRYKFQ